MKKDKNISDLRENYQLSNLNRENLDLDPMIQFKSWFDEAMDSSIKEANAMSLATVNADGIPSVRTILLKELDDDGFVFYTNYESDKANDLKVNPNVALVFLWKTLERQVRIQGRISKVSEERSTNYFQKRPKGSQIGAWASNQSSIIQDKSELQAKVDALTKQYSEKDVLPKPDFWGGYKVIPFSIEFWQGRPNRLHDRFRYEKNGSGWRIDRLAP